LYAHDPTKLFAGIASRARQIFGIKAQQIHVDTNSFSVSGQYDMANKGNEPETEAERSPSEAAVIAITHGYSRDHREERTAVDDSPGHDSRWGCAPVLAAVRRQ
jgi:transposase